MYPLFVVAASDLSQRTYKTAVLAALAMPFRILLSPHVHRTRLFLHVPRMDAHCAHLWIGIVCIFVVLAAKLYTLLAFW